MLSKMRSLGLMVLILGSAQAQASFYQDHCSNADSTLRLSNGHVSNVNQATYREYGSGQRVDKPYILDVNTEIEFLETRELENESTRRCMNGGGVVSWRKVSYSKIRVTREDGALFPEQIVGVSEDRKSINASVICEHEGNSRAPDCQE